MDNADPYGLSKEVDERTAEMFTRRYPMSVAALRRGDGDVIDLLRGLWGYVDLRDAARACRLAVETAATQTSAPELTQVGSRRFRPRRRRHFCAGP